MFLSPIPAIVTATTVRHVAHMLRSSNSESDEHSEDLLLDGDTDSMKTAENKLKKEESETFIMQNIIENNGITILFDEARAIRDLEKHQDAYEQDVKKRKRYNKIRVPLVTVAVFMFAIIAYFKAWENTYATEGRGAYLVFAFAILVFGWILVMMTDRHNVEPLKERYDWNVWYYLFQKDKNIIGAEIREHINGETCELVLRTLTLDNYIVTEIFNVRERVGSYKDYLDKDFYFKRCFVKGIDNITVDIIKGEVQLPYTENSENNVIIT